MQEKQAWIRHGQELRRPLLVNPALTDEGHVVVVGAGLSGLTAAYRLREARPELRVTILEGSDRAGGVIRTWRKDGWVGELAVKGPNVMKGYWNRPEETQKTLKDGWLFTGDLAKMDEDGYFYIVDRKKDMIIAGGYNIYPREVEEVLYQHEAVQEAAVVGVPDPYRGETVAAFLVLKPEYQGKVSEKDIERFCRQNLAAYKVPRIIQFRESLPKSSVGKILRRELREEFAKKQG